MSMKNSFRRELMVFVKCPRPGLVKKRLGAQIGEQISASLYRAFVLDLLNNIARYHNITSIWYHPKESEQEVHHWLGQRFRFFAQAGHDLGSRMAAAFKSCFARGATAALLIGSDLPDLPADYIEKGFENLARHDVVIGPSLDGGYYLIGFKANGFCSEIFHNVHWGSATVYEDSAAWLKKNLIRFGVVPQWSDVDELVDLWELLRRNKKDGGMRITNTIGLIRAFAKTRSDLRSMLDEFDTE